MNYRHIKSQAIDPVDHELLHRMVRADQLEAVRHSVLTAIPVNAVLGLTGMLVALNAGLASLGILWFTLSSIVNAGRAVLCRRVSALSMISDDDPAGTDKNVFVERHLRLAWVAALVSGSVWALVPIMCQGYTSPQTIFYLTVVCGITAGAVTHGNAYAAVPTAFVVPPLLSAAGCLFYTGGFDRISLGMTVLLYLAALIRTSRLGEKGFREGSLLKNEATTMAVSLRAAHAHEQEVAKEMQYRALHDSLTGLLNRDGLLHAADSRVAERPEGLVCLLLDLDGFKAINDVFGHKAGDEVLVDVANLLRRELAGMDAVIGRLGGDEFAALYDAHAAQSTPESVAARIIGAIASATVRQSGHLGVSIGISVAASTDVGDILAFADAALYVAKRGGRNQYYVFDRELRQRLDTRRDMERDLPAAIAERAIEVWFQPIIGDPGSRLDSLEALLRWKHPRHGWLPPEDIIFIAANTGLSEPLLRFILGEICTCLHALCEQRNNYVVAMNVSPREMSRLAINDIVMEVLGTCNTPARLLEIEITEETALDIDTVQHKLGALAAAGIRIAVDDFGVGYSSLASLRSKHVHRVKIDRSFVRDLAASNENQVLVESILNLGGSLGIEVVAEGVETIDDMRALRSLGCHLMQGFYLARPMPLADALAWVRQHCSDAAAAHPADVPTLKA